MCGRRKRLHLHTNLRVYISFGYVDVWLLVFDLRRRVYAAIPALVVLVWMNYIYMRLKER